MGYAGTLLQGFRGQYLGFFQVLERPDWRPKGIKRNKDDVPGRVGEYFGRITFIYRAIDSGMVTLPDVTSGRVTLSEIAEANHYLDMKADIEYYANEKAMKKTQKGGRH